MKRMHALPIELPLVASGEWDSGNEEFILDKSIHNEGMLLFVIEHYVSDTPFSSICVGYINTNIKDIGISSDDAPVSYSTMFTYYSTEQQLEETFILKYSKSGSAGNVLSVFTPSNSDPISSNEAFVIYLYKLPYSITLP